jgi:hypothetical protein
MLATFYDNKGSDATQLQHKVLVLDYWDFEGGKLNAQQFSTKVIYFPE